MPRERFYLDLEAERGNQVMLCLRIHEIWPIQCTDVDQKGREKTTSKGNRMKPEIPLFVMQYMKRPFALRTRDPYHRT